jgi:hypothetical protein
MKNYFKGICKSIILIIIFTVASLVFGFILFLVTIFGGPKKFIAAVTLNNNQILKFKKSVNKLVNM